MVDDDASQMKETLIHSNQAFITHNQFAEIAQPGESAFDFPPVLVALPDFWRLLAANFAVSALRDQEADPPLSQFGPQFVRSIGLIAHKALGSALWAPPTLAGDFDGFQGLFCQPYFRRRCRGNGASQRNTLTVDHHHPLRALASLGFPDSGAPFLPAQSWRQ